MKLSKVLWRRVDENGTDGTCADDEALYIEVPGVGYDEKGCLNTRFYRLTPAEITREEFDAAWDRSSTDETE